jgi:predicted Zn-ribbon and HTH transcriptional regulator
MARGLIMNRLSRQRQYSCSESLVIALCEANAQDIRLKFKTTKGDNNSFTCICSANDNRFRFSVIGGGSSTDPEEAKAKAAYEALEWSLVSRGVHGKWEDDWTGLGTGATFEEAVLHGINEWIERDGYAMFLLRCLVKENPEKARFLVKASLPPDLLEQVETIERRFNESLLIVDISTDIRVSAFLVSFTRQTFLIQPMGLGASPFKEEAFVQALYEAVQCFDRYNADIEEHRKDQLVSLGNRPPLLRAFCCDLENISERGLYIKCKWKELVNDTAPASLFDQVEHLSNKLTQNGYNLTVRPLFSGNAGFSIAHVQIDNLETFYRIKEARFTPPTLRGLEALK